MICLVLIQIRRRDCSSSSSRLQHIPPSSIHSAFPPNCMFAARSGLTAPLVVDEANHTADHANKKEASKNGASEAEFLYKLPFSSQSYYMMRPIENVHIYIWILKDLAWAQDWYYPAMIFGILALAWCAMIMYEAWEMRSWYEAYMCVATTLWLAANFVWMSGEVFNNDDDGVIPPSAHMMEAAIAWLLLYYCVLKPLRILAPDEDQTIKYKAMGLHPRFSFFENWREYEHSHTLLWLCKDLCWNQLVEVPWIICMIPTLIVGADFVYLTAVTKKMTIDSTHYLSQLIWVAGNACWAMGELFSFPGNDDDKGPYSLWHPSDNAVKKLRWWSAVILFISLMPFVWLYCIWLPFTCHGYIRAADIPENKHIEPKLTCCGGNSSDSGDKAHSTGTGSSVAANVL